MGSALSKNRLAGVCNIILAKMRSVLIYTSPLVLKRDFETEDCLMSPVDRRWPKTEVFCINKLYRLEFRLNSERMVDKDACCCLAIWGVVTVLLGRVVAVWNRGGMHWKLRLLRDPIHGLRRVAVRWSGLTGDEWWGSSKGHWVV